MLHCSMISMPNESVVEMHVPKQVNSRLSSFSVLHHLYNRNPYDRLVFNEHSSAFISSNLIVKLMELFVPVQLALRLLISRP